MACRMVFSSRGYELCADYGLELLGTFLKGMGYTFINRDADCHSLMSSPMDLTPHYQRSAEDMGVIFHYMNDSFPHTKPILTTAIMVDGGFYLKRAKSLFGEKSPKDRANELFRYCLELIKHDQSRYLYRIFYYDCPPAKGTVFNPLSKEHLNLEKTELFKWANEFHKELSSKRKVALRMGELSRITPQYYLKPDALKRLMAQKKSINELTTQDLWLNIQQKGVDTKLGIDVASLAYGGRVNQIITIAGDSDFVPAAKIARRNGIDFIVDPMRQGISPSLSEHIDGIETCCSKPKLTMEKKASGENKDRMHK